MKNKISLITLIACAAAGTTFAADPVEAFRASSGTTTNSTDTIYVGNTDWGSDSKEIVDAHFADLWSKYGPEDSFEWDPEKKAFYTHTIIDSFGGVEKEYESYDFVFVLDEDAQFENAKDAAMSFRYEGETAYESGGYDIDGLEYFVTARNMIVFAGSSKFTNAGTLTFGSEFTGSNQGNTNDKWKGDTPPGFLVFQRDKAVFENKGTISAEPNNYIEWVSYYLFGNAKFVNAEGGEIKGMGFCLSGDSVFENAGTIVNRGVSSIGDIIYILLRENAKLVNTGTIDSDKYNFSFEAGFSGTSKIENRGTMTGADVDFRIGNDPILGISASFENYGTIKPEENSSSAVAFGVNLRDLDKSGNDVDFRDLKDAYTETMHAGDLNVKNFGTIDLAGTGTMSVSSGVKLTLAQGSTIAGNLEVGKNLEFYLDNTFCTLHIDKDVLNIELTGQGGNAPLISGDLELCNSIELDVSFAEDAVKKTKYELTLWGGELTYGTDYTGDGNLGFIESSLSGTLDAFDTTYIWSLDTATGVLTAKDVNFGEEIVVDDPGAAVSPGENDVVTIPSDLEEFYGTISGSGQVDVSGSLTFTGDMSEHTGTTNIGEKGTFTVTGSDVKLGTGTFAVKGTLKLEVQGTFVFEAKTTGSGALEISSGATVSFSKSVGVKTLNVSDGATLRGGVTMNHGADAVLDLAGTLALDADAGEKVTLGGGKVVLAPTAKLDLGGNAASGAAQTQTLFADATNASSALGRGATVTIFEGGNVEGDAVAFLATDSTLSALASQYAVIYDKTNGLTVRALTNPEAFANGVDTSDLSASFIAWSLGDLADELETLPAGFTDAAQLGALGGGNDPLLNALLAGDAGTARSILDRLSPKSYAAMIAMPVETFHDDARNVSARLAQRRFEKFVADAPWEFFAQAQMISVDNDTASDAPTFDFDRYGVFAGADFRLDETTTLGLALGAGTGDADIHNGGGKIESTDFRALAYFGKTFAERFYVNAGAQIGFSSYDVKRTTDYGSARGETDGWNAGAFAEAGAAFAISETHGLYATPYVGLAYAHAETDSFSESGSDRAAFDADSLSGDSLRARIGCAFSWGFDVAGARWRVGLDAAYSRELLDDEIDVDVTASDGSRISETSAALPEDVFSIGPTLNVDVSVSASIYAGYAFNAGTDSSTTHSANVGFRMRF